MTFIAQGHTQQSERAFLRWFPYPYRAGLAICSDVDGTESVEHYVAILRYLNTKEETDLGPGLSLEIGNSFYFYDSGRTFSYFTHHSRARGVINDLIHAGYTNCLHTYGNAANSREQALRALDSHSDADSHVDVWVNHTGAKSNLGEEFDHIFGGCQGDDPNSGVYHSDVTVDYGIRFAWIGGHTRLIGQEGNNRWTSYLGSFNHSQHRVQCVRRTLREMAKGLVGHLGDERFALHASNKLTRPTRLRDGQQVHEFVRYCNHPRGILEGGTAAGLAESISAAALERLKKSRGLTIVYTHFGQNSASRQLIPARTQVALRNLEHEYRSGNIYVTTTSKLLNFHRNRKHLTWNSTQDNGHLQIDIKGVLDPIFGPITATPEDLQGMTFYVPDSKSARVKIGGEELAHVDRNPADETGKESVSIPLTHLTFPLSR